MRVGKLMTLAVLSLVGCGGHGSGQERPGAVVLIVIDTLRADHLGCAGYPSQITPVIDSIAKNGVRFSHAYTAAPVTLPAITTLLTGLLPYQHEVRDNQFFALAPASVTLPEQFRAKGWHTAAVVGSAILSRDRGLDQGFEVYDDAFREPYQIYDRRETPDSSATARTARRAGTVAGKAVTLIRGFGKDHFFLFVHFWDVHFPYDPPPQFLLGDGSSRYAGEVRYVDAEIGNVLHALRRRPDALILVVADHGEGMMEHGEPQHGFLLYDQTLHVPLVVAGPGVPSNTVRDDPVGLVDVATTLASVCDLPGLGSRQEGRVLRWESPEEEVPPLYSETFHTLVSYGWSELRSLRNRRWKVIEGRGRREWFDLIEDPGERRDLGGETRDPILAQTLEAFSRSDPAESVAVLGRSTPDPDRMELLRSLGYLAGQADASAETTDRPHPLEALPRWFRAGWARVHVRLAGEFVEKDAPELGISQADSALALDPELAEAYFIRGVARERLGRRAEAAEDWRRCLVLDEQHLRAHRSLADLEERSGRTDSALAHWARVVELDDRDEEALARVSTWYLDHGKISRALPYLRRMATLWPDRADVQYNLGLAAAKAGMRAEADEHWSRYLFLAPDGPQANQVRDWLKETGSP